MQFPKTITDRWSGYLQGSATVKPVAGRVELWAYLGQKGDEDTQEAYVDLTPEAARKLARILKKAAKVAEGNG